MCISRLKNSLNNYDPFGEHRVNGLKAVLVLELLFLFNYVYSIPNPYFYYFYVPLTAFAAEVAGTTLKDKFVFYAFSVMGAILAIFIFNLASSNKTFFVIVVLLYSLLLYWVAIYKLRSMFVPVPLILSLAAYSLLYSANNNNFYIALNHGLQSFVAMLVVMAGLVLFPRQYYLWIWRKAFYQLLLKVSYYTGEISRGAIVEIPIIPSTVIMHRYALMLSPRMRVFSILKITVLAMDLVMSLAYLEAFQKQLRAPYILFLHRYLNLLSNACRHQQPLLVQEHDLQIFQETHELRSLYHLIKSWNYLCLTR